MDAVLVGALAVAPVALGAGAVLVAGSNIHGAALATRAAAGLASGGAGRPARGSR